MKHQFRFVFTVIATTFIFLAIFISNVIFAILSNILQNNINLKQKQTEQFCLLFKDLKQYLVQKYQKLLK